MGHFHAPSPPAAVPIETRPPPTPVLSVMSFHCPLDISEFMVRTANISGCRTPRLERASTRRKDHVLGRSVEPCALIARGINNPENCPSQPATSITSVFLRMDRGDKEQEMGAASSPTPLRMRDIHLPKSEIRKDGSSI